MQLKRFDNAADWEKASVDFIKLAGQAPQSFVGISGGATPLPIYQALAGDSSFDFSKTEFFVVDERAVPFGHPDSNYGAMTEAFAPAKQFLDHFHFFDTKLSPEEAAKHFTEELAKVPSGVFDLIILGLGSDGHAASLFPGSPANSDIQFRAVATINENTAALPVRDRLTITWPVILAAKQILVLAAGESKEFVLRELIMGMKSSDEFPARHLAVHPNVTIYFRQ